MVQLPSGVKLTWLGHSTFVLETSGGKRILIDPWVMGNPACPERLKDPGDIDAMLITHAHFDHIGDAVELGKKTRAQIGCIAETANWLGSKGLENIIDFNIGGTTRISGGPTHSGASG